jgi:arylsulfatase A-like enzyme
MKSRRLLLAAALLSAACSSFAASATTRPHVVLVMADDMGWGQTGYYNHPVLKTPHLDAMAANGLRLDRFYAGAPNCSPTRASVLTGRSNDRTGVRNHGYALRRQEKTLAPALRDAGYVTGHFGKWHLNGYSGPGAPIFDHDSHHPGRFGFDEWVSVTNFFDLHPVMSRQGKFEEFQGDSSEIIVDEALKFIARHRNRPTFTVIWYGTPHSPYMAMEKDKAAFAHLDPSSREHYGELVAMDRSIGTLRQGLRRLGIADNTLVWFCSDNGGLPNITPETVGGLRGLKSSVYEGGLRVPAVIEWPAVITAPRITRHPASTMDMFPTIADITGMPASVMLQPVDGVSLLPLFSREIGPRTRPVPFRHTGRAAYLDNRYKLVTENVAGGKFALYDLEADPKETNDISASQPEVARRMREAFLRWNESVERSAAGMDYPEGKVDPSEPPPQRRWNEAPEYQPYLKEWLKRPEYAGLANPPAKKAAPKQRAKEAGAK